MNCSSADIINEVTFRDVVQTLYFVEAEILSERKRRKGHCTDMKYGPLRYYTTENFCKLLFPKMDDSKQTEQCLIQSKQKDMN